MQELVSVPGRIRNHEFVRPVDIFFSVRPKQFTHTGAHIWVEDLCKAFIQVEEASTSLISTCSGSSQEPQAWFVM